MSNIFDTLAIKKWCLKERKIKIRKILEIFDHVIRGDTSVAKSSKVERKKGKSRIQHVKVKSDSESEGRRENIYYIVIL